MLNRDLARKISFKAKVQNDPNKRITLDDDVSGCIGKFLGVEDSSTLALLPSSKKYNTTTELLRMARTRILKEHEDGKAPITGRFIYNVVMAMGSRRVRRPTTDSAGQAAAAA